MKIAWILALSFLISSCQIEETPTEENEEQQQQEQTPDNDQNDQDDDVTENSTELYNQISCGLKSVYNEGHLPLKRSRTLKFIVNRLAKNFKTYGLSSNIEKAHYLSQLFHESDGLTATVERLLGPTWRRLFDAPEGTWQCDNYLDAINEDDSYFNHSYIYSKNSYRSKFRGRGLIQLTGCFNYLGFFYHSSAQDKGDTVKANLHKTYFPYRDSDGDFVQAGMYCSDSDLDILNETFKNDRLEISPNELLTDFEESVDEMALPCQERSVANYKSERFIVDSSFWYWKKCQTQDYFSSYTSINSDQAVARITECIHGRNSVYQNYASINCNANNSNNWRKESYCSRRKAFKAILSCMK